MRLHVLASGSKGNAAIVENVATGEGLLIDCGICKRDFFTRCDEAGFDLRRLRGVLITHEHTDHTKGLGVVYRGLAKLGVHPTIHVSDAVRDASRDIGELLEQGLCDIASFAAGDRGLTLPDSRFTRLPPRMMRRSPSAFASNAVTTRSAT